MTDPITLASVYQIAITSAATAGTTAAVVNNSSRIGNAIWRYIHGCGTYRVMFSKELPGEKYELCRFIESKVPREHGALQRVPFIRKTQEGKTLIRHVLVPHRDFTFEHRGCTITGHPMIIANGEIGGIEFWSHSWFRWNSAANYTQTVDVINGVLDPKNAQHTAHESPTTIIKKNPSAEPSTRRRSRERAGTYVQLSSVEE